MVELTPEMVTGLHSRAVRTAANRSPSTSLAFCTDQATVTYAAHAEIVAAVAAHLFYDTRPVGPTRGDRRAT